MQGANWINTAKSIDISAGTFSGGTAPITCAGPFNLSGGTFTAPSTSTLLVKGSFTGNGNFDTSGGGTVQLNSGSNISFIGGNVFNNLEFNSQAAYVFYIDSPITVNGLLTYTKGQLNNSVINAKGNVVIAGSPNANANCTTTLSINGSSAQTCTIIGNGASTFSLPALAVNNASASVTVLGGCAIRGMNLQAGTFNGGSSNITCLGDLTSSTGFTLNSTTSTLLVYNYYGINSSNITLAAGTFFHNGGTFSIIYTNAAVNFVTGGNTFNNLYLVESNGMSLYCYDDFTVNGNISMFYDTSSQGTILQAGGSAARTIH